MLGKLRYDRTNLLRIRSTMEGGDPPQAVQQKDSAEHTWRRNSENHFRGGLRRNDASAGSLEEFRSEKHHSSGQSQSASNGGSATVHTTERNAESLWVYRTLGNAVVSAPASWSDIQNLIDEQLVAREEMEVCRVGDQSFVPYVAALAARTSRLAPQPVSIDDIEGLMGETRSPKKELPRISSVDAVPAPPMLPQAILPPEPLLPNTGYDKQERAPHQAPSASVTVVSVDKAPAPVTSDAQPGQSRRHSKQSKAKVAAQKAVEAPPVVATTATAQSPAAPTAWGGKGVAPKQEKVDIEALIVEEKRAQEARSKQEEQDRLRVASEKPTKKKATKSEADSQKTMDKNFPALESIVNEGNSKRARKG